MNIYKSDKRCYGVSEYIFYLNKKVGEGKYKEKLDADDKLARVLLFNLEHYSRYHQERGLTLTLYVLDHYAKIEQDQNDAFGRSVINLSAVPGKVRKTLYRDFREYNDAIETLLTADEETIARLIEEGLIEVEGAEEEIIEEEPEEEEKEKKVATKAYRVGRKDNKGKEKPKQGKPKQEKPSTEDVEESEKE